MRRQAAGLMGTGTLALGGLLGSAFFCFAGATDDVVGVPGPVAAVGLPALVLLGGATWLSRRMRDRRRNT
jgi:hypothetical protein